MMSFGAERFFEHFGLFHFLLTSEKEMLRSEVGMKEGAREENRKETYPPVMWVMEGEDDSELSCAVPAVPWPRLGRVFPPVRLQTWILRVFFCEHRVSSTAVLKLSQSTTCHTPVCKIRITGSPLGAWRRCLGVRFCPCDSIDTSTFISRHRLAVVSVLVRIEGA